MLVHQGASCDIECRATRLPRRPVGAFAKRGGDLSRAKAKGAGESLRCFISGLKRNPRDAFTAIGKPGGSAFEACELDIAMQSEAKKRPELSMEMGG